MNVWEFIMLVLAPLLGGAIALLFQIRKEEYYKLVLSFSGSFLFAVTILHLLPEVFYENIYAGPFLLLGFFIQILLEQTTHGIEHGHFHQHEENPVFIFSLVLGLSLHSFLDGIPVSIKHMEEAANHSLLYGISLHKIPEGFALASIFLYSKFRKSVVIFVLLLFSLVAPCGALLSGYLQEINAAIFPTLLAIVAGSFLHISTTILFESESTGRHSLSYKKIIAITLGAGISLFTI